MSDWVLAGFDNSIFCTLLAVVLQPALVGCWAGSRGVLAGFDNRETIFCTLLAAVWQPALTDLGPLQLAADSDWPA